MKKFDDNIKNAIMQCPEDAISVLVEVNLDNPKTSMQQLEKHFETLKLNDKPVKLTLADAFCIVLLPSQIIELSKLDFVGFIRANRTHTVR